MPIKRKEKLSQNPLKLQGDKNAILYLQLY